MKITDIFKKLNALLKTSNIKAFGAKMAQAITPLSHYMNSKTPCISIYMYIYARTNVGRDIERIQQKKTLLYIFPEIIILNLFHSSNIFFLSSIFKTFIFQSTWFLTTCTLPTRKNEWNRSTSLQKSPWNISKCCKQYFKLEHKSQIPQSIFF